jgi:predicted transcriptional regulator
MSILAAAEALQGKRRTGTILQSIYDELPQEEKAEFIEVLDSKGLYSSVCARAIQQSGLSVTANKYTVNTIAHAIRRYRRGEITVAS